VKGFVISAHARKDIVEITVYTKRIWGLRQADRYLSQLEEGFDLLAQNSSIGRPCMTTDPELFRFEVGKHVVFFRVRRAGIRIVRILHQQMIPLKTHFES
jgi:toxin ParE1/3/4